MGTSNFNNDNARKIYSITTEDEFIWQDTRDNIASELEAIFGDNWYQSDTITIEELRSYPATSIGAIEQYVTIGNHTFTIEIISKIVSGYYEGFSLDYDIKISSDFCSYTTNETVEEAINDFIYELEIEGEVDEAKKRWTHQLNLELEDIIEKVEKVYQDNSDPLVAVATFSNGETIYQKAE